MSIFTHIAISPSPWSRQRPSRYAIRAGRNLPDKEFRSSHLHVAMKLGPYLQLVVGRVGWRMASEDSRETRPLSPIHLLRQSSDSTETVDRQMRCVLHLQNHAESVEVRSLSGDQWVLFEERLDDIDQLTSALHKEASHPCPMIVIATVSGSVVRRRSAPRGAPAADSDGSACVTEHSCWTCQPSRHTALRTTLIENGLRRRRSRRPTARVLVFPADCPHHAGCHLPCRTDCA